MSDGNQVSRLDRPVVVVVQKVFERAAILQGRALGAVDLPICVYTSTGPQGGDLQADALGVKVAEDAMRRLAGTAPGS